ncbi:hypothetical protein D3C80_1543320 [compost metagenome]
MYNLGRVAVEVTLQAAVPQSALGRVKGIFHCAGVSMGLAIFGAISLSAGQLNPSTMFLLYGCLMLTGTGALLYLRPKPEPIEQSSADIDAN